MILKNIFIKNKVVYYVLLFFKKLKIVLHNFFEPKIKASKANAFEDFQIFLWTQLFSNLKFSKKGYYYKTKVTNKNSPMILSQARVILILCNNYEAENLTFNSKYLIKSLTDYLISMREDNGLFKFNQSSWNLQDEGIASVWATLALIKSYEVTNDQTYLDAAKLTLNAMLNLLYSKETSLIHTIGDEYWCLNSASTFAYVCSLILNHSFDKGIQGAMIDSINICVEKIADDGHFPYNEIRPGTYLLLYHPIVMITLGYCLHSQYMDSNTAQKLKNVLDKAKEFLISCITDDNKIFEPEITHYSQYIISNVTTLLALKGKINPDIERDILNNISSYWNNDKLFICKDSRDNLYNSDLYSVIDVLLIEVLYWIDLYKSNGTWMIKNREVIKENFQGITNSLIQSL
jgi:hypothetical protein